jgi:hypothetical protein
MKKTRILIPLLTLALTAHAHVADVGQHVLLVIIWNCGVNQRRTTPARGSLEK